MTDTGRTSFRPGTLWFVCMLAVLAGGHVGPGKGADLLDELNRMELEADRARTAFWCGRYEDAEQLFSGLSESVHPSVMLYLNECAMCELAQGDYEGAERRLRQVVTIGRSILLRGAEHDRPCGLPQRASGSTAKVSA